MALAETTGANGLITFAHNPDKVTSLPGNRGLYYAASCEMKVWKDNPTQWAKPQAPSCTATSYSSGL